MINQLDLKIQNILDSADRMFLSTSVGGNSSGASVFFTRDGDDLIFFTFNPSRKAEQIKIGKPEDGSDMGPLISRGHREKVFSYFELAKNEGANVITGGKEPAFDDERQNGAFIEPTIWTGLSEDARCIKEEIFGPVCHISPFDSEEEVIHKSNDSDYGLAAAIWTKDMEKANRVARRMEVGICWVNDWFLRDLRTPFGGVKLSGIGREGGLHSLEFYSEPLTICIKH